jgi:hypothetical protein
MGVCGSSSRSKLPIELLREKKGIPDGVRRDAVKLPRDRDRLGSLVGAASADADATINVARLRMLELLELPGRERLSLFGAVEERDFRFDARSAMLRSENDLRPAINFDSWEGASVGKTRSL